MNCTATHRKTTHSWGTTTEFGHKPCGAPATHTKRIKAVHHDVYYTEFACEEHATEGYELLAAEVAEVAEPVAVDVPTTTCTALATPGNMHFMTAHCIECNAFRMARMNVDTVEGWYRSGHFSQAEYEAYMHAWATGAYRYGSTGGWEVEPTDPKVVEIVAAIRRLTGIPGRPVLAA